MERKKREVLYEKAYKKELLKIIECGNINKYDRVFQKESN